MEFLGALWLPILLSSVFVFVVSSLIHMVVGYHAADYRKLPNEDAARAAIGPLGIPPGDYMVPRGEGMKAMKDPEFIRKWTEGPVALMTVLPNGKISMASSMVQWFLYILVINVFAAYVASHAVPWGGSYLSVFRFVGTTTFLAYSFGLITESIWHGRQWGTTMRFVLDGFIYALVTAGVFGWLWPKPEILKILMP